MIENNHPITGAGIGLRSCHYQYILEHQPDVSWFEALTDNYMMGTGSGFNYLTAIREHYPMVLHGVGLSLGSTDVIDYHYLNQLKQLINHIQPAWISDHLCWNAHQSHYLHDLLPLPLNVEVINHISERIKTIQDYLGTQILVENVSSYMTYHYDMMPEWEFINRISADADCLILLDINNVYINANNHNFNPNTYIHQIDAKRVKQYHLAGHVDKGPYLFDTHSEPIQPAVWDLYRCALRHIGPVPTLIEWDSNIPTFEVLHQQASQAAQLMDTHQHETKLTPTNPN